MTVQSRITHDSEQCLAKNQTAHLSELRAVIHARHGTVRRALRRHLHYRRIQAFAFHIHTKTKVNGYEKV